MRGCRTSSSGADSLSTQILTIVLIVLMSASTFTTQRQLMQKNMPASALDNPFARQQKMLMYVLPLFFAISGVNFPIGVLLYWLTTNVWSMGQQFYVIRRMPAPGSQAERDLQARRARKAAAKGLPTDDAATEITTEPAAPVGQRQQPKRNQPRSKRAVRPTGAPGAATDAAAESETASGTAAETELGSTADGDGLASPGSAKPGSPPVAGTSPATPAAKQGPRGPGKGPGPAGANGAAKGAPNGANGRASKRTGKGSTSGKPGPAKTG